MFEIKDWNGHHVLAIPLGATAARDPVRDAYAVAAKSLADDLGVPAESMSCRLCPMYRADAETGRRRCAHPRRLFWAFTQDVAQGGCSDQVIVAEEYIPLVKMRLDPANSNR